MDTQQLEHLRGTQVVDPSGDKIGKIEEIYLDEQTNQPEWLLVNTGLFGTKSTFIPLQGANPAEDKVEVPFAKDQVKDAPGIEPGRELSRSEENELYRYYGIAQSTQRSDSGLPARGGSGEGTVGRDTSGPTTDDAMTRSEEELRVGTAKQETGKVRLRKHVVTDHVEQTVPVQREEVRVEREPVTEANAGDAMDGPAISEEEHEVTLHEEVPVVQTEAKPVERVRLDTETVTDEETVEADVRKEQVEIDGDNAS
jgi:uncharacterized protein (TIGR02271 family)